MTCLPTGRFMVFQALPINYAKVYLKQKFVFLTNGKKQCKKYLST